MRLSRDSWLAIGLFLLMAALTIVAVVQQTREAAVSPALASFSNQPDGSRALWLWLSELGYTVQNEVQTTFMIPPETDLVLMLEPLPGVSEGEWRLIDEWVANGGTLLLAGNQFGTNLALRHYDFSIRFHQTTTPTLTLQTPLFSSPLLTMPVATNSRAYLHTTRRDFATHVASAGQPAIVSFVQGEGRVILSSLTAPFSNAGLQTEPNPALALNIIGSTGPPGVVWFNEWHHGVRLAEVEIAANNWLQRTPTGRAIMYAALIIFVALVLRGQRFGRPTPLPQEISRRAPLEYITAIANLSRRAGHQTAVLHDYRERLKRRLGHRYRLSPDLPDDEFVARLADYNPNLDRAALRSLLQRLSRSNVSESELVHLAAEASKWMEK